MSGQVHFLLINGSRDHYWHEVLEKALAPLGALKIGREEDAIRIILHGSYVLVIIDATVVENVPLLVARIRAQCRDIRIVVATASPTWTRAREAFQAGATDYMRKSLDEEDLRSAIRAALVKTLPPWQS